MKGQDSFHARFRGICRGCGKFYLPGQNVWSPKTKAGLRSQPLGLFHVHCQPEVSVRQATPEEIQALRQRSLERRKGLCTI